MLPQNGNREYALSVPYRIVGAYRIVGVAAKFYGPYYSQGAPPARNLHS